MEIKSKIGLMVKKDVLKYVYDEKTVRAWTGHLRSFREVKLGRSWIKRWEEVNEPGRIKSKKMKEK